MPDIAGPEAWGGLPAVRGARCKSLLGFPRSKDSLHHSWRSGSADQQVATCGKEPRIESSQANAWFTLRPRQQSIRGLAGRVHCGSHTLGAATGDSGTVRATLALAQAERVFRIVKSRMVPLESAGAGRAPQSQVRASREMVGGVPVQGQHASDAGLQTGDSIVASVAGRPRSLGTHRGDLLLIEESVGVDVETLEPSLHLWRDFRLGELAVAVSVPPPPTAELPGGAVSTSGSLDHRLDFRRLDIAIPIPVHSIEVGAHSLGDLVVDKTVISVRVSR